MKIGSKKDSMFLPPINKESLENLKQKMDLIKVYTEGGPPKNPRAFHQRKGSETERKDLI